jgi:hypothetical protein
MSAGSWPVGVSLSADIEHRPDRPEPYRARVRWIDPATKRRKSKSQACSSERAALDWIEVIRRIAQAGIDPETASMTLAIYGDSVMPLALRGLEGKTLDPYLAGWRKRVVPALGHLPLRMITNGAVDRAVHGWIAEQCSRSTVKNSLAVLVRVMEQAVRDGILDRNPARVIGWQRDYQRAEDELDDPRSLALPDWQALCDLAAALVARSADHFEGWGDVVIFAACSAARIGEVSGIRCADIGRGAWTWTVRRQTTPSPGGLIDKGTKGKRARTVPLMKKSARSLRDDWTRSAMTPRHASSRVRAAAGSPRRCCGTQPTGTRSSPSSATSICAVTTSATPALRGWPMPVSRSTCSGRSLGTDRWSPPSAISTLTPSPSRTLGPR